MLEFIQQMHTVGALCCTSTERRLEWDVVREVGVCKGSDGDVQRVFFINTLVRLAATAPICGAPSLKRATIVDISWLPDDITHP